MKTKFFLLVMMAAALVACQHEDVKPNSGENHSDKYAILYNGQSPYLDWYFGNKETFVSYIYRDYPTDTIGKLREKVARTEDNTIHLNADVDIRLHDVYSIHREHDSTYLVLTRSAWINQGTAIQYADSFSVSTMSPIDLIRPHIDSCTYLPMCYYDNFVVEWNADQDNQNGVVIIAEWNGCTMHQPAESLSWANVDIVKDDGLAVLNTDLFEKMPNQALVNLWLIRGNLTTLGDKSASTLATLQELSEVDLSETLHAHPELLIDLQPFMLGSGAVTTFSFFLIKEL